MLEEVVEQPSNQNADADHLPGDEVGFEDRSGFGSLSIDSGQTALSAPTMPEFALSRGTK